MFSSSVPAIWFKLPNSSDTSTVSIFWISTGFVKRLGQFRRKWYIYIFVYSIYIYAYFKQFLRRTDHLFCSERFFPFLSFLGPNVNPRWIDPDYLGGLPWFTPNIVVPITKMAPPSWTCSPRNPKTRWQGAKGVSSPVSQVGKECKDVYSCRVPNKTPGLVRDSPTKMMKQPFCGQTSNLGMIMRISWVRIFSGDMMRIYE